MMKFFAYAIYFISYLFIIFSMLYLKDKYQLNFWTYLVISVSALTIVSYFTNKIMKRNK